MGTEDLANAGVLLDLGALHPNAEGARVTFSGGKRTVVHGPFADPKEVVAGYWILGVTPWTRPSSGQAPPLRGRW